MQENQKYATYFPAFYEFSALTQWAGLRDYESWIAFWRVIFLVFNLAVGSALFFLLYPRGHLLAAVFAVGFWFFNRWTLHVSQVANLDFIPIFLLIVSLGLFRKHRWAALCLFSLSLGIKQIGIFLAPLYLIWTWQAVEVEGDRLKQTLLAALVIASMPVLASLPFLAWNAEGLVKSVLCSVTRNPDDHFNVASLDGLMGWFGLPARLPSSW
jgi:Gpi18-like mannosyltransferase